MGLGCQIATFERKAIGRPSNGSKSRWVFNLSLICLEVLGMMVISKVGPGHVFMEVGLRRRAGGQFSPLAYVLLYFIPYYV